MNSFYAFVFRQKYITRWALMRNSIPESLSEHSAEVAVLAHALALIGNRIFGKHYDAEQVACAALFHDVPEVITGDLPTPVKYCNESLRRDYGVIEEQAISSLLSHLPAALREDYGKLLREPENDPDRTRLVKAADKLAAYIKCIEEEKCGNTEFRSARLTIEKALQEMCCEELHYFMRELLPAFRLTLDEIT